MLSQNGLPDYARLTGFLLRDHYTISTLTVLNRAPTGRSDGSIIKPCVCLDLSILSSLALKNLEPDWWLELERTYRERSTQRKKKLYADYGKLIMNELPGSQAASKEYMQMVVQYLWQRYSNLFQYDNWTGMFMNRILGSKTNITAVRPLHFF